VFDRDADPARRDQPRFSVNVDPDMTVFHTFTSCGLHDVTMVSLAELAAERGVAAPTDTQVRDAIAYSLGAA
jgi:lipoyl(octanoyl) transferase